MSSSARFDTLSETAAKIEAILFTASSPVSVKELAEALAIPQSAAANEIRNLFSYLEKTGSGIVLQELAGGWKLMTSPLASDAVARFRDTAQRQKIRLSKAAVETLAVIAYNQPVTRSEIEDIRGVRCERVIETLLSHGIVRIAGRKKGTGSPLLYRPTDLFLETFGLAAISDLPTLEELQELGHESYQPTRTPGTVMAEAAASRERDGE